MDPTKEKEAIMRTNVNLRRVIHWIHVRYGIDKRAILYHNVCRGGQVKSHVHMVRHHLTRLRPGSIS